MKKNFKFIALAVILISIAAVTKYKLKDIEGIAPTLTPTELNYVDGVTSNVQTQLNSKGDLATATTATTLFYTKKEVQNIRVKDELLAGLQAYGCTIKGLPYGVALPHLFSSTSTMVDGTLWDMLIEVKDTVTVTGIGWVQQTQGAYTADNYNGWAIYSNSGGTDTKIVETVNDGNLWKAAVGNAQKAFASPQTLYPGNYKVCAVYNTSAPTTAPVIYTHSAVSANITYTLPNSQKISGTVATQATMPTTIANSSLTAQSNYLGFYFY